MTRRARVLTLGCLALGACSSGDLLDPTPLDPPILNAAVLCVRQDSLVAAAGAIPTIDQTFEILARLLPGGFGGLYSGGMFLVNPERLADTRAVAATLEQCAGRRAGSLSSVQQLGVLHGDYDWVQLTTWRARIETDASVTVLLIDIDESRNRLGIGVTSEAARQTVLGRLRPLNVPSAAVAIEVLTFPPPG